jgi:D-alanyl-lipoteichoic acid acyltransferase DltB (MBOAT superfamily)
LLFPTVTFAAFFMVVLAVAGLVQSHRLLRKLVLICAGAVFYAYWELRAVLLLAAVVLLTWGLARLAGQARRPAVRSAAVVTAVVVDLATLGLFKYYDFFATSLTDALNRLGVQLNPTLITLALPLGLSFYLFEAMSYVIDVRRDRLPAASLLDVATWLSFFPKLASGPITRAAEFMPQLRAEPAALRVSLGPAYTRIARGLLKKLVIASFLGTAVTDQVFADPNGYSSLVVLVAVYAYAAMIYADFSGYTDMAIGLASLLGFTLPENFNRPYAATSIQDFWSRWHMTLSRWLRDYLFAPLVGRGTASRLRVYAGLIAVMLLAGLWHGAAWGFVVFGGVHGVAMAVERFRRDVRRAAGARPRPQTRVSRALQRVITFHVVCLGWVFFASGSVGGGMAVLGALATNWSLATTTVTPLLLLVIAGVMALQFVPAGVGRKLATLAGQASAPQAGLALAASLVVVLSLAPDTVPAFIYFRF